MTNVDDPLLWAMISQEPGASYLDEGGRMTIASAELPDGRQLRVVGPDATAGLELYRTLLLERSAGRL
jgi:hypothetical protein